MSIAPKSRARAKRAPRAQGGVPGSGTQAAVNDREIMAAAQKRREPRLIRGGTLAALARGMRSLTLVSLILVASACGGRVAPDPPSGSEADKGASAVAAADVKPACGGPGHVSCGLGSYCWSNGCAVTGDEPGTCFTPVGACDDAVSVPACGCDGKVYANACEATRSGVGWRGDFSDPSGGCR